MTGGTPPESGGLRILVLNWLDRENPLAGGAETHLHETFGRLAARGHSVTLLCSGWPGCPATRVNLDGIDVHRAGRRYTFSVAGPAYYRRHLAAGGFDVVVEDLNKVPLFSPWWTKAPVALLVHHLFGTTAFQEASVPLASATWALERPIPMVFRDTPTVSVSESTREDLIRRGLPGNLIEVIPNGIELERFGPDPQGVHTPDPTILFLGRVKKYKRVDLLIRAVARLRERGVRVVLRIGGRGSEVPALERLAERLGVSDRVEFLGFVTEAEKLQLFRRSWIHALTSPKEGWGIANLEAAACGTPTVASDSPGLRESVVHGETGLLVPHGDIDALTDAISALVGDPALRSRMSVAALAFAKGYSWDASAERMEAFLQRVAGRVVGGNEPD